jgi:hypothetical protein
LYDRNRTLSSGLNLFLLFRGRKFHRLFDELCIFRHPLRRALFFLAPATKLAHHDLFMAMGEQNTVPRLRFSFQTLLLHVVASTAAIIFSISAHSAGLWTLMNSHPF